MSMTLRRVILSPFFSAILLASAALFFSNEVLSEKINMEANGEKKLAMATFAGGCFWCMEGPFDKTKGVHSTISGYTGGHKDNPTYREVSAGTTGHTEAIQVTYDPSQVTYEQLLEVFWKNIDPLDASGQFCDKGSQYRSGIFFHDDAQEKLALASRKKLDESGKLSSKIVTEVTAFEKFYPAEDYHQDYYKRNPIRYRFYRAGCGRDRRLSELWGDS